eukprot:TRINITY_DN146_c1_g1_i1.p1 TRINITY_DN146_c1_g1~~TRINITY_DN146_c1_g1_i1.p1  ORF type:complete len:211 (+),score=59.27 TRINITY_DN146_c1_g1_i1:51-635(+)
MMSRRQVPDYDEEARILFRKLNLPEDGSGVVPGRYNPLDVIWQNKVTGAKVFVGNHTAAADMRMLRENGISHIVNCQDTTTTNYHEGKPGFYYKRFPVSYWRTVPNINTAEVAKAYFEDVFKWVEEATNQGQSVLIHCLAGAHRAGTTGTAFLMRAARLPAMEAIRAAKKMRPAIDPICDFPTLLKYYEKGLQL